MTHPVLAASTAVVTALGIAVVTTGVIIPWPVLLGAVVSLLLGGFWFAVHARSRAKELDHAAKAVMVGRVAALETQLALVGQQVLPLSAAWQKYLIEQLTHFHTPELDALMVRDDLADYEVDRMNVLLKERITVVDSTVDPAERIAAEMLPLVLRFVKVERDRDEFKAPDVIAVEKPPTPEAIKPAPSTPPSKEDVK